MLPRSQSQLIYFVVFYSELSFFFSLPLIADAEGLTAFQIGSCFAWSVILESFLLIFAIAKFELCPRNFLLGFSMLLRVASFILILLSSSFIAWFSFYTIIAIAKSMSKPFTREVISEEFSDDKRLQEGMNNYSLFQNIAIIVAPLIGTVAVKFDIHRGLILFLVVFAGIFAFLLFKKIYSFPRKKTNSDSNKVSLMSGIQCVLSHPPLNYLLYASFLTFFIMGVFITITTLVPTVNPKFAQFVGLFFSVVGISVSVWQGLIVKKISFTQKQLVAIATISGILSSFFLSEYLIIAILALIFYSIFEAILVPQIYYLGASKTFPISTGSFFGFIIVASNLGDALGTFMTGIIIDNFKQYINIIFPLMITLNVVAIAIFITKSQYILKGITDND